MPVSTLSDVRLDATGDLPDFTSLLTGIDTVAQRVSMRLQMHLGEWFADPTVGLPWKQWAGLKPLPLQLVEARVRNALVSMAAIDAVQKVTATRDDAQRSMNIDVELLIGREVVEIGYSTSPPERRGNVSFYVRYRRLSTPISSIFRR